MKKENKAPLLISLTVFVLLVAALIIFIYSTNLWMSEGISSVTMFILTLLLVIVLIYAIRIIQKNLRKIILSKFPKPKVK